MTFRHPHRNLHALHPLHPPHALHALHAPHALHSPHSYGHEYDSRQIYYHNDEPRHQSYGPNPTLRNIKSISRWCDKLPNDLNCAHDKQVSNKRLEVTTKAAPQPKRWVIEEL